MNLPRFIPPAVSLLAVFALTSCGDKKAANSKGLESVEQRFSYGMGYRVGKDLGSQPGLKLDQTAFAAGLKDALENGKLQIDEKKLQEAFAEMQKKFIAEIEAQAKVNLQAANDFLAKNKSRSGVKTTSSGLQYEVVRKGFGGAKIKPTDKVRVHYHGTLTDGTVFDSSVQRGQPAEFQLNGVIPGWIEGLQLMSAGDKFKFYIPPGLAYGPRPTGKIPPNSLLIFEIELLSVN